MNHLNIEGKNYVPAKEAAALLGYTSDYIAKLCREGKIKSKQISRAWYVEEDDIQAFKEKIVKEHEDQRSALSQALSLQYAKSQQETPLLPYISLSKKPSLRVKGAILLIVALSLSFATFEKIFHASILATDYVPEVVVAEPEVVESTQIIRPLRGGMRRAVGVEDASANVANTLGSLNGLIKDAYCR